MKKSGLTDKSMSNKCFYKTEKAIFIAYCKFQDYPKACRIAKQAGISRSTLYRHHRSTYCIPRDYEDYLLSSYSHIIRKLFAKPRVSLKLILLRTLAFISNQHEIFGALFSEGRKDVIKKMIRYLQPKIIQSWPPSCDTDQVFSVYENEVLAIIELWGKHRFSTAMLDEILSKVLYLTKTAPRHLAPINSRRL